MATHRLLCVDPDESTREETAAHVRSELTDVDFELGTAATVSGAEELLTTETGALVTEYDLPDGTGFDLIKTARHVAPDAGCVLYTDVDLDTIDTSELRGAVAEYVGKGSVFGAERLAQLVRTTVETRTQTTYPLPQDERERLAALRSYDLDDPALEASLDRITSLAASHLHVERASINIISEHSQKFLACYGEADGWDTMDREDSICTFTILEDDVMTVEDTTEDPRFESRSDTLADMGIRAYMGANLVTPAGLVVGPLCVYDEEPRSFSPADQAYLSELADLAMDLLELHAQVQSARTARNAGEFR